ncbi:MAG: hypothetical protein RL149_470 [Actinomycetota bacterium]|jgi:hypothetical protein
MRFLVAAVLFVLSTILILTGLAQRTVLAPPSQYSLSIKSDSKAPYAVIPAKVLNLHPGAVTVSVKGPGHAFIASGRESDIVAYVGDSGYSSIMTEAVSKKYVSKTFVGSAPSVDPTGSDLWRAEVAGQLKAKLQIATDHHGAALVASDGLAMAPQQINLLWTSKFDFTWANALMISGALLLLVAAVLTFITFRKMRIDRGPRRRTPKAPKPPRYRYRSIFKSPQRGRRAARGFIAITSAGLTLSLLSGCSANPAATPSPTSTAASVPVSLLPSQVTRILKDVAEIAADADASNDKRILAERFAGAALAVRSTNYVLRSRSARIAPMQTIAASPIKFNLPAATDTWPRVLMAVTDEKGDTALPQMIALQQDSPRSNYKVWFTIRLMPGAKIPDVPPATLGAIPVDAASLFLKMPPNKLPISFGDVLNVGQASLSAQLFDLENEFYKQVSQAQDDQATTLNNANITFAHLLGDPNVISLATSNGGALVAVYQLDRYTIKPKKANSAVSVGAQEKLLLGATGSTRGVRSVYGDMLLFYVPPIDETGKIILLGATQGLISVASL